MGECLKNKKKVHDLLRYGFLGVLIVMGPDAAKGQ